MVELVVAHFQEDLRWLGNAPGSLKISLYHKDPAHARPAGILLPNTGREAHTCLHHLCSRYDSLADVTVFCQGRPFDHAYDFHAFLRALAATGTLPTRPHDGTPGQFCWLGHLIDTEQAAGTPLFRGWSKNPAGTGLALQAFFQEVFAEEAPAALPFVLGGQFAVTAEAVHHRPKAFYENALHVSQAFPDAAHCFERCWGRVFGVEGINCLWLAGRKTVALKPIRDK